MELPPGSEPVQPRPARRPTRLHAWMAQARRDARMLLDGLRGVHPPPLLPRPAGRHAARGDELRATRPERDIPSQFFPQPQQPRTAEGPGPVLTSEPAPGLAPGPQDSAVVLVHIGGRTYEVTVQPDQTILDATLAAGLPMPFSCTLGGCGACKVTLRAGEVALEEPNCLTYAERAAGGILTCVGRPLGPITIEVEAE